MQVTNGQLRCEPGAQGGTAAQRPLKAIRRTGSLEGTAVRLKRAGLRTDSGALWVGGAGGEGTVRATRKGSRRARPGADQDFPRKAVRPGQLRVELSPSDRCSNTEVSSDCDKFRVSARVEERVANSK